ncbi:MAG: hypothetical protein PVF68_10725 [Acidobacteriota bacterium]|jgi:hypothetical protein
MRPRGRILICAGLTCLATSFALAHHILGIPHYRYDENYPQIPYVEVLAQVGTTELNFTHFPGIPEPGQRVRFKLYVHDRETGEVHRAPLRLEVFRRRFLRSAIPVGPPLEIRTGTGPEANDYKFFLTFPEAEAYEVRLRFPGPDGVETIPFPVTIGRTDDRPLVFGAAGLLAVTILGVAVARRRTAFRPLVGRRAS